MQRFFPNLDNESIYKRVRRIAQRMRQELAVSDRIRYEMPSRKALLSKLTLFELLNARLHRKCFVGYKAVEWIVKSKVLGSGASASDNKPLSEDVGTADDNDSHAIAEAFLNAMLQTHVFHDVRFEREFHADHHLYRFAEDDTIRVVNCLLDDDHGEPQHMRRTESFGITSLLFDSGISDDPLELSARLVVKAVKLVTSFWKLP